MLPFRYRSNFFRFCLGIICALPLWLPAQQRLTVTSLADRGPGSLRATISQAQAGDTLDFAVTGQLRLDTTLVINRDLLILGPGAASLAIDGQDRTRHFEVQIGASLHLQDLTLQHGATRDTSSFGGGAILNQGFLTMTRCLVQENVAVIGGAIQHFSTNADSTSLILEACTFLRNRAYTDPRLASRPRGGAIYADNRNGGILTFRATNCTFAFNEAPYTGGAISFTDIPFGQGNYRFTHCTIYGNDSDSFTGGIDVYTGRAPTFSHCLITGNTGNSLLRDFHGTIRSQGYNVLGDTLGLGFDTGPQASDRYGYRWEGAVLVDFGTGLPVLPLPCGHPAVDAGNLGSALGQDQLQNNRLGLPDVGAVERDGAAYREVSSLQDAGIGSLRLALALACPGDTLDLGDLNGTLGLRSSLVLSQEVHLRGNASAPLVLSGGDSLRVIEVLPGIRASLSWFHLRDGRPEVFGGGAIQNKGQLTLRYCALTENAASAGGAIANYGDGDTASLLLSHCTLGRNHALDLDGGAIDTRSFSHPATTRLQHCTLSENSAFKRGGALFTAAANLELLCTLLAGNQAESGPNGYGSFFSEGYNLVADTSGFLAANAYASTDLLGLDPQLGPLNGYGGPTPTYALQAGSPAIDAGTSQAAGDLDQRGFTRTVGADTDIGAYEYDVQTRRDLAKPRLARLFPNPSDGPLRLETYLEPGAILETQVIDLQGRIVWQRQLPAGAQELQLDLPAGIYWVYLRSGQQFQVISLRLF